MTVLNFGEIGKSAAKSETTTRPVVQGRTLQFDADFSCYEVSVDLEENIQTTFKRLLEVIDYKRRLAGAEFVNAFITLGKKSGRESMATVKEYQENRDPDKPIKVRVKELRTMLAAYEGDVCKVVHELTHEADDLMCIHQNNAIRANGVDSSVIMSGDKDLWMVQGWHCDAKTGRMYKVDGYGKTEYREVGNVKPKLIGEGTSWFWHQMIMGDTVDNIPGLPYITNDMLDVYFPLKSGKARKEGKGLCGESKAVTILDGVTTDVVAASRVFNLYRALYKTRAVEMFMEQGFLLWMQRKYDGFDLDYFLDEIGFSTIGFTEQQCEKIRDYNKTMGDWA